MADFAPPVPRRSFRGSHHRSVLATAIVSSADGDPVHGGNRSAGSMTTPELANVRQHGWIRQPDTFTAHGAAVYAQALRDNLVQLGIWPGDMRLVPPTPDQPFAGLRGPHYSLGDGVLRGLASGETLYRGYFARAQEMFPQLTRVFFSTHEAFHHVDAITGATLTELGRRFPELQGEIRQLNFPELARTQKLESTARAMEDFKANLTPEQRGFFEHRLEIFADACAAVYLRANSPQGQDKQVGEFLRSLTGLRDAAAADRHLLDVWHASGRTLSTAMDAYDGQGRHRPMTMEDTAQFVQSVISGQNPDKIPKYGVVDEPNFVVRQKHPDSLPASAPTARSQAPSTSHAP